MFQDGVKKTILPASRAQSDWPQPNPEHERWALTPKSRLPTKRLTQIKPMLTIANHSAQTTSSLGRMDSPNTGFLRFPFNNFRYSLTLFSKFFASFPHGTCALSVSHQYLALDGIYHQIWAAIPSNSTHSKHVPEHKVSRQEREFHPLSCPFPRDLARIHGRQYFSRPQFAIPLLVIEIHMVSSSRFTRRY